MKHGFLVGFALLLLAGCGHERSGSGSASLWVTRDRGAAVVLVKTVPAGLTAMQALDRELDVDTAYGGRFVQSIEGVEGDVSKRHDWFWFLNGIEADLSAADYRLRPGDVEWWDFRSVEASARARGRRRVSRALPARVRRAAATGCRAHEPRAGRGARCRAPVERGLRPAPFGPGPERTRMCFTQ